ncbi:MAG TPA: hypothetical protein VHT50_15145, partial [Mycobacterium sp.]|nr:hypothetical protein [Mycobacterium sp.]
MSGSGWQPYGLSGFFPAMWQSSMKSTASGWSRSFGAIMDAVQRHLAGREIEVECAGSSVILTVMKLDAQPDLRPLPVGQFGEVAITARDVTFESLRSPRVTATLRNAHLHPGS